MRTVLRACRPRQWSKNLLVLAAPCAAGVIGMPEVIAEVTGAFISLSLLASSTYLVNDVRDYEPDRVHPKKCRRPIAAGQLSKRAALQLAAAAAVLGLALAFAISIGLGIVCLAYLTLTASYSVWLRRIVYIDMLAIAGGFVLRAVAGGFATEVYLSRWFILMTASGAIFLVAGKRFAELREQGESKATRETLQRYSVKTLGRIMLASAAAAAATYSAWAVTRPTSIVWYCLSAVPLLMWLGRYASLIRAGAGQAPEELILRDRALLALTMVWGLLFLGGVYVGS